MNCKPESTVLSATVPPRLHHSYLALSLAQVSLCYTGALAESASHLFTKLHWEDSWDAAHINGLLWSGRRLLWVALAICLSYEILLLEWKSIAPERPPSPIYFKDHLSLSTSIRRPHLQADMELCNADWVAYLLTPWTWERHMIFWSWLLCHGKYGLLLRKSLQRWLLPDSVSAVVRSLQWPSRLLPLNDTKSMTVPIR